MIDDCWVLKFLRRRVEGKHLIRFHSENAVVKFPQGSMNEKLFENVFQTAGIWKRRLFVYVCTENILKTDLLELKTLTSPDNREISLFEFSSQTKIQIDRCMIVAFLTMKGKHLMRFQSVTPLSKFPQKTNARSRSRKTSFRSTNGNLLSWKQKSIVIYLV